MTPYHRYWAAGAACLIAVASGESFAQTAAASVSGTVRSAAGAALSDVVVLVGRKYARTDSLGRYRLDSLDAGSTRIIIRHIGFSRADTTFTLRVGERIRWDVALREDELFKNYEREAAAERAQNVAAGHIDSIAEKLLRPNADHVLPLRAFGSRFFSTIVADRGPDSNTVVSPLSAALAMSLTRFGARGATADAFDRVLAFGLDQRTVEMRGAEMMAALSTRTDVTLEIGNAIWIDTTAVPAPTFRESVGRWRASIASVPIASQEAAAEINHWADSVTHGKIATILRDRLPADTRLFIANAVYFKGKWLDPFEKSETRPGDFTLPSGERITVPRMNRLASIGYRRDAGYQTIRLPYRTGKTAMYIILPDADVTFDAVARRLAGGNLIPSTPFEWQRVHVVLPRFHSELELNLVSPLKALGLGIAFAPGAADFSEMARRASDPSIPIDLHIGSAIQKVYIDVDEEGTEAAAVTAFGMEVTALPPPPIEFVVDRPFLFVLRDELTGTDLFIGRIARP